MLLHQVPSAADFPHLFTHADFAFVVVVVVSEEEEIISAVNNIMF